MSLPQVYVYASTLGDFLNGEQRHIEEHTRVVTYDGIELFRTTGALNPNDLLYRADQHTLLHNACVAAFPDGYKLIWSKPPVAQDPTDEGTADIEAHIEASTSLPSSTSREAEGEAVTGAGAADQVPPVADPSVPDQQPVAADTAGVPDTTLNTKVAK